METLKIHVKAITLFLSVLMMFQSCTVYKGQNISLEQAALSNDKVKLVTKSNQTLKYLKINEINQEYFGVKKVHGDLTKVPIQKENIETIMIKNKPLSATLSILTFLGGAFVLMVGGFFAFWSGPF